MIKKFRKHLGYYLSLLVIFALGLLLTVFASPNIRLQSFIIFITVIFYVLWALLHHYVNHELNTRIMVEYLLVGAFGLSIIFFMLMGGFI